MKNARLGALAACLTLNAACAIPTRQTDALLRDRPGDVPVATAVAGVPFVLQEANFCGPASLAMVMAHAGAPIPVETLANQVYTPGKKGTLQVDLVGAARRHAMLAVEIRGLPALLRELAAGHPVLTLENLGLSWYPRWHYAVVTGYDLDAPSLTLHSGRDAGTRKSMRKFERCWADSGSWGLVVLKPGELAAGADELAHAVAASALEQLGHAREAELAYRSILGKWPDSLGALIGMGNLRDAAGDHRGSAAYLERAVRAHPGSAVAWHNLAVAQGADHQLRPARRSAAKALSLAGAADAPAYRESLKAWLAP